MTAYSDCVYVTGQVYGPLELQHELYEFSAVVIPRKKTASEKGGADYLHFDGNLTDEDKEFLTDKIKEQVLGFINKRSKEIKETTSLPFGDENKTPEDIIPFGDNRYFPIGKIWVNYIGEKKETPELPDFNFEVKRI